MYLQKHIVNTDSQWVLQIYSLSDNKLWLGGFADYERGFNWIDGSPFEFVNWLTDEPNNYNGKVSLVQNINLFETYFP